MMNFLSARFNKEYIDTSRFSTAQLDLIRKFQNEMLLIAETLWWPVNGWI